MTKITIEIDTDGQIQVNGGVAQVLAPLKIGVLSSIKFKPQSDLLKAFEAGAGINGYSMLPAGYEAHALQNALGKLVGPANHCQMIVTVGGSVVHDAVASSGYASKFVSLLGTQPPSNSPCAGGVVLNTINSNQNRVDYLEQKLGRTRQNIALYRNPGSAMQKTESDNWSSLHAGQVIPFSGWDSSNSTNDSAGFYTDFQTTIPSIPNLDTIVVSADPFFQSSMEDLIKAANDWLGKGNRFICFPLQEYQNTQGTQPIASKALFYGPSLTDAYRMLGTIAKQAALGQPVNFYTPSDKIDPP